MHEADYWPSLEYRLAREFAGIEECVRLGLWCDGFIPQSYDFDSSPPCIQGTAWICPGQAQQEWRFSVMLVGVPGDRESVDWTMQLPPEGVTKWMVLDFEQRFIEIEPGVAVDDASQQADGRTVTHASE